MAAKKPNPFAKANPFAKKGEPAAPPDKGSKPPFFVKKKGK